MAAMTQTDQARMRAILEALSAVPDGLSADALSPLVEIATGRAWTDEDRKLLLLTLRGKGLISTYTNRVTDVVTYLLTDLGRVALSGMAK